MDYSQLTAKKVELDKLRPLSSDLVTNLENWFRVELTYTSNAIEGNTLSRRETALVVEKGITVGGKTLVEHLEATNHAKAVDWITKQVQSKHSVTERDLLKIHELILSGIDDNNAGFYRNIAVRISGSTVVLPNPRKVPDLMSEFGAWLSAKSKDHPVEKSAEAHYRLVTVHPFVDGNGRTARLLMNLLLMKAGYPPAIIRKNDRLAYLTALETAQTGGEKKAYLQIIVKAVNRSLDLYLKAAKGEDAAELDSDRLYKIGEVAKKVGESNSTVRHWTKLGLIFVADITDSGYQLYSEESIKRIEKIHALKKERFSLEEIKEKLNE